MTICTKAPFPSVTLRSGLICMILAAAIGLFYLLGCRFLSEYHQFQADALIQNHYFGLAEARLKTAAEYQPRDSRIYQQLGKIYLELADRAATASRGRNNLARARDAFQTSIRRHPHSAEVHYRLGLTVARLEAGAQSEDAISATGLPARFYFQEAVRLRPNGLLYNYALLHDLARHGEKEAMIPIVRELVAGYPPIYADLKRKAFWTPAVESACIEGLHAAVEKAIFPKQAFVYLSKAAAENKQWTRAVAWYRRALDAAPAQNTAGNYLHLGKLYIQSGDLPAAVEQFVNGLSLSPRPEATLEQIYRIYKSEDLLEGFNLFFTENRDRFFFSYTADILYARFLMDLKRHEDARQVLEAVNTDKPRAEAYYWLARIAQAEKDWDRMELAIQKATLYDPRNPHYRRVFAGVLRRQKKIERAAREMEVAKELSRR
ncbi:MAG: tetratricopeptide repeat protein [Thermodesulfobacteriota bacterium]